MRHLRWCWLESWRNSRRRRFRRSSCSRRRRNLLFDGRSCDIRRGWDSLLARFLRNRSSYFQRNGSAQRNLHSGRSVWRRWSFRSRLLSRRRSLFGRWTIGNSSIMNRAAPGTKSNLFLLRQRGRGRNSRLRRQLDGCFRDLIDNWLFDNDRFFRNDRLLDDDGLRFRRSRLCGSPRGRFVNCLRCRLGESGDLPPQFQKFAV